MAQGAISACETGGTPDYTSIAFGGENSPTNGCQNVDKIFSSFNVTGAGFNNNGLIEGPPDVGQIGLNAIGTLGGVGGNALGIQLVDSTTASNERNDWFVQAASAEDNLIYSSQIDFVVSIDPTIISGLGGAYQISGVTFSHSLLEVTPAAGLSVSLSGLFCPGATTVVGCSNLITLGPGTVTGDVGASSYSNVFAGVSQVAVSLVLNSNLGTDDFSRGFTLNSASFQFDQIETAPEPATFGLAGAALIGLAVLARKRRKG